MKIYIVTEFYDNFNVDTFHTQILGVYETLEEAKDMLLDYEPELEHYEWRETIADIECNEDVDGIDTHVYKAIYTKATYDYDHDTCCDYEEPWNYSYEYSIFEKEVDWCLSKLDLWKWTK